MKPEKYALIALLFVTSLAQLKAQTLQAKICGSTAFPLEAGIAIYTFSGVTTTRAWTTSPTTFRSVYFMDQRVPNIPAYLPFTVDYARLWMTWTPGSTGTCAPPSADSVVSAGNPCQQRSGASNLRHWSNAPEFIPDAPLNVFHMRFGLGGVDFNAANTASDAPKVCGLAATLKTEEM